MPNRIEARSAKAALTNATGRLPLLRLFSTPLKIPPTRIPVCVRYVGSRQGCPQGRVQATTHQFFSVARVPPADKPTNLRSSYALEATAFRLTEPVLTAQLCLWGD